MKLNQLKKILFFGFFMNFTENFAGPIDTKLFSRLRKIISQNVVIDPDFYIELQQIFVGMHVKHLKKGTIYKIVDIERSTANPHRLRVCYKNLEECPEFGYTTWSRPAKEFFGRTNVNGKLQDRFVPVEKR